MAERVAVEDSLSPVRELLAARGYEVVALRPPLPTGVVAVVVNGMDEDFMGRTDRTTRAPVIDAAGRTPEEVLQAVRDRARLAHPAPPAR